MTAHYVYIQTVADKLYTMYGGEPDVMPFTMTEKEAKKFFGESYRKIQIQQLKSKDK